MSAAATLATLFGAAAIAAAAIFLAKAKAADGSGNSGSKKPDFLAKPLMTPNELEFFLRLEAALPEFRVFPQVALGALLNAASKDDKSKRMSQRGKFQQKIVDFAIQRRSDNALIALVELDDRTHSAAKDAERDAMTREAGYRTIRWQSKSKPDREAIRAEIMR